MKLKRASMATTASILLAASVLSACSQSKETEPPASAQPKESAAAPATGGKYDPPIELTSVNFTYGSSTKFGNGDDMNNNPWTRHLKDTLGISVKTLWEVPSAELEQKTNLLIASGELPDFFLVTATQLVQLEKANLIEDMTNVYKQHAPDNVKQVMEQAGKEVTEAATIKGKLMGIPFTGVAKESVPLLWVREDWMKKLNLPEPKTMQDVLAISEAFTNKDPDGNGKNDTFGLAMDKDLGLAGGLLNAYHAYRSIWVKDKNGQLAYSSVQPEMKTALAKLQEMYKTGQLDKEFGVKNTAKVNEDIGSNKVGMMYSSLTAGIAPLAGLTKDAVWKPYPAPSADGQPTLLQHPLNTFYGFWVVKKGTKHPEAVLKLADEWIKLFYLNTSDDLFKKFNADGSISYWMNSPVKMYKSFKNAEISTHLEPLLKSDKKPEADQLAKLTPEERQEYDYIQKYKAGDKSLWGWASRSEIGGSGSIVNQYIKNNQFMPNLFTAPPTPAMVQKNANLLKTELEVFTKIILGESVDLFDQFVSDWKKLGGDEMTKEVNDWYKSK
ncbi:extracellular solute-binding protein [Paenibacillus contaminans]|uniref:ABC transporter substrate-binding protein n=1 Tax=Paenibacillus contaminans TaxID=450362 RepID=A0A329M6B9_9BACL|nr:extracellular solute-binding protein [Paenibacillus contaminans]RAV15308.1 ABC transporter substrate-binding protein [Paenibacillus contaminans]